MTYYSQIGQDKYFIENIAKRKKNGRFLDIGANNGVTESNTLTLEREYGWTGICVEADEKLAQICAKYRTNSKVLCEVVWSSIEMVSFSIPRNGNNLLSRIDNIQWNTEYFKNDFIDPILIERQTTTIQNILGPDDQYFDYFSLDIEGAELEALKGIDWNRTAFGFITVEYGNREDYKNLLINFLSSHNYILHRINRWDLEFIYAQK